MRANQQHPVVQQNITADQVQVALDRLNRARGQIIHAKRVRLVDTRGMDGALTAAEQTLNEVGQLLEGIALTR